MNIMCIQETDKQIGYIKRQKKQFEQLQMLETNYASKDNEFLFIFFF